MCKTVTVEQIKKFYENKKDCPCPITDKFIKTGYQQERGGYIKYAYEQGMEVDYKKGEPTQWWHLIKSYCERTELQKVFPKSVKCGELYIWMAEVSGALRKEELEKLVEKAVTKVEKVERRNKKLPPLKLTRESNEMIRDACYSKIMDKIPKQF